MTSNGGGKFRFDERELQASALRSQVLEQCHRTLNHDINNAVQSIHSGLELLTKCLNTPGIARISPQECIALLQQQFATLRHTLDRMVKDIAEPPGDPETFDASALVTEALQTLRHERAASKAQTRIDSNVLVHARKVNIRSFTLALLLDAIDDMGADGVLHLDLAQREGLAVLEIRRTRSARDAAAVNARPTVQLVKRLLAAERGELRVEHAGEGVAMIVHLPSPAAQSTQDASHTAAPKGPLRVLIADRNRDAADSLAMILQLEGMHAQALYSGTHLAETLARFSPDVALIDIDLPGCDVREVARTAKQKIGERTLLAQVSSTDRLKHEEFDAHLLRPVEWPQLQALIARARR
jgi:CheY-like chemotaxis protein